MAYALQVKNLEKVYSNGKRALNGVNFNVEEGDFFALLGANGAGKSTTISIISTLVNKTSGEVSIFDNDINDKPLVAKRYLGVVPQELNFNQFEKTIDILINQAGYFGVTKKLAYERAEYYLTKLGLWEKRNVLSRSLSGGMKRRLMISRALMHEPRLLVLDEPTAGVDVELRRSLWLFLQELNEKGISIILTTHYLEEAEFLCRNIAIINDGKIIKNTSMKELLSQLEKESYLLDLKEPLGDLARINGYEVKLVDERCIEVEVSRGQGVSQLFNSLNELNIEVISMRNKSNRLEEMLVGLIN